MSWFKHLRPEPVGGEGQAALEKTRADRPAVEAQGREAERLGRSFRRMREQNHFAEAVAGLLRGHS